MSVILQPHSEAECLHWAGWHEREAARLEAQDRHREAADCRTWASTWRSRAASARARDLPAEQHPDQLDLLTYLSTTPPTQEYTP